MGKKSHSVKHGTIVKKVKKQFLFDLNQLPDMENVGSSVVQPKDDVPPPPPPPTPPQPHFSVNLCFLNEDMAEFKHKYKVLGPPPVTSPDYFENLGFVNGCNTLMYVSDKKFPGKSLYPLAHSWFKEGVTKEDKCVSKNLHKKEKCHRTDDDELKGYLKEFLEEAEAVETLARMSRRKRRRLKRRFFPRPPLAVKKGSMHRRRGALMISWMQSTMSHLHDVVCVFS